MKSHMTAQEMSLLNHIIISVRNIFLISYFLMQHCRSDLRKTGVVTTGAVVGGTVVGAFGFALCGVSGQFMPLRNLKSSIAMSPLKLVPLTPSAIICYMHIN